VESSAVSVVTRAELFAGGEREEPAVEALLGRLSELEVTVDIARQAGRADPVAQRANEVCASSRRAAAAISRAQAWTSASATTSTGECM
jgi:predicted nucleic acid-binding protein